MRPELRVVLAPLLLAGCLVGPDYERPDIAVAAHFGAEPAAAPPDAGERAWWRRFADPSLAQLVDDAVAANFDVRIATAQVRAARALLQEARLELLPIAPIAGGYERQRRSDWGGFGQGRDIDFVYGGFDATWELDVFGRVRRGIEARDATVAAEQASLRDVLVSVAGEVATNYFQLRGAQQRLAVARRNADNQQATAALTVRLRDGGRGTELDSARAEAQLASTLATVPVLEAAVQGAAFRLSVLTGRQPRELLARLAAVGPLPSLPTSLAIGTPGELLQRRPDLAAAERRFAAAVARVGVASADQYPRLQVVGSFGLEAGSNGGAYSENPINGFVGPRLSWAGFDWFRVQARLRGAEAQAEAALVAYERAVVVALEETEGALLRYGNERVRLGHLGTAAQANARAARLARQRFEDGVDDFLTVLDAERRQLESEDLVVVSATEAATALVALYKALGGGFAEDASATDEAAAGLSAPVEGDGR